MSNNLINGDSFDFVPGTEKTAFDALSLRVAAVETADEPVELYSGSADVGDTITLTEAFTNFRRIVFFASDEWGEALVGDKTNWARPGYSFYVTMAAPYIGTDSTMSFNINGALVMANSSTSLTIQRGKRLLVSTNGTGSTPFSTISKVYGIGRISS